MEGSHDSVSTFAIAVAGVLVVVVGQGQECVDVLRALQNSCDLCSLSLVASLDQFEDVLVRGENVAEQHEVELRWKSYFMLVLKAVGAAEKLHSESWDSVRDLQLRLEVASGCTVGYFRQVAQLRSGQGVDAQAGRRCAALGSLLHHASHVVPSGTGSGELPGLELRPCGQTLSATDIHRPSCLLRRGFSSSCTLFVREHRNLFSRSALFEKSFALYSCIVLFGWGILLPGVCLRVGGGWAFFVLLSFVLFWGGSWRGWRGVCGVVRLGLLAGARLLGFSPSSAARRPASFLGVWQAS